MAAAAGGENERAVIRSLCHSLINNIDSRWSHYERTPLYAIATLLDPMYKDCAFMDDQAARLGRTYIVDAFNMMTLTNNANENTPGIRQLRDNESTESIGKSIRLLNKKGNF